MSKLRLAGKALEGLRWLFKGQTGGEIALRVIPDAGFGILQAALTPGDIGDKIIAGTGTALGGITGGAALGKLGGRNQMLVQGLDLAGSVGGDFAGQFVAENLQRLKGGGKTPYERLNEEQFLAMKEQATVQALAELGLLPSNAQAAFADPSTGQGVA